ncbi:MAG: serine hydrolase [Marinilabiliales bacterium]|nr:serine hydrolase [Marinilabiliales bacterium]
MILQLGFQIYQEPKLSRKMALMDAPYALRTKFRLINPAFLTAGELIPRITGKSWEETVKEKILLPLKMDHTLVLSEDFKTASNRASPHSMVNNKCEEIPIMPLDNLAPAGSISSSIKDMTSWILAQLNDGVIDGQIGDFIKGFTGNPDSIYHYWD